MFRELEVGATFYKYKTQNNIDLLMKNGANVNLINNEGKTGTYSFHHVFLIIQVIHLAFQLKIYELKDFLQILISKAGKCFFTFLGNLPNRHNYS